MRKGEKGILIGIGVFALTAMLYQTVKIETRTTEDPGIPFYSTASKKLQDRAGILMRKYNCRDCHAIWGQRNIMQFVPAPALDGIGALRDKEWLYNYFSSKNPQSIVPSRLKKEYRMPSFANTSEDDRRDLAQYMSSLKVKDWYLKDTKKSEYEKLTGKKYKAAN